MLCQALGNSAGMRRGQDKVGKPGIGPACAAEAEFRLEDVVPVHGNYPFAQSLLLTRKRNGTKSEREFS